MLRIGGFLILGASLLCAQTDPVRVWQDTITFPTYRERPPDPLPPFDQFELAGNGNNAVYPYTLRNNMTAEKYNAPWRVLHLENQYLHCLVLPDLGGRLYTCRDKLSGTDVFYANTAIKKADVAPRSAWIAAGIETSFPIAHSRVTVSPVHFATTANDDGSATVFVGAVDRIGGMEWRVAYTLRPGSTVLQQKTWLYNPGSVRQPYQWWTNAAIRLPDRGLQFTYPMWVTAPHGAGVLDSWPVDASGVDRSRTDNYAAALGVFAYGSREPFFAEYNPQSRTGVAHWADPGEVPGKKVWVYGKNETGYKNSLSDDHSGYAEIQSGLMTTQDMMQYLEPQQSRSFTELWIPSRNTGGISRATPAAVLFLQRTPQPGGAVKATIDLNVTSVLPHASLTVTKGGETVFQQSADLDPATAFHAETAPVDPAGKFRFELKDASGQVLLAHQEDTYDAVTPAEVKIGGPLPAPARERGPEADALAGAEADELLRFVDRAALEYGVALTALPKSPVIRKAAARFDVALHRFAEAAAILAPLRQENPSDPETAYYLGVARSELGDDAAARPLWESILREPRFGAAAQDRLACALARAGQQKAAAGMLHSIAALGPGRAAGLEVALLRRMGQTTEAQAALRKALAADPMDSLLRVEAVLLGREDAAIWMHLAADPEWVLDVADEYLDAGLYQDAFALLDRNYPAVGELQTEPGAVLPQDYSLIAYYRGYAALRLGQLPADDFRKASEQSTLYVHPYRASSFPVLRAAVEQNPADATAHYLLGCLLFNSRFSDQALAEWNLAKPSAGRIPAYYETVARVLAGVKQNGTLAENLVREGLAAQPADAGLRRLLANIRSGSMAGGGPQLPPRASFGSSMEAASYALAMMASHNLAGAEAIFQSKNFPQEKQPPEVRQAYAELRMQGLLAAARPGKCEDVAAKIEDFAPEDKSLSFTFHGFGDLAKQLRMQFYFGLAESLCGDRKAADRRWSRIAKAKAPASSADFAFPMLAASLVDPAGSQRAIETVLESVRTGGGPADKGLRLYAEGMLLRAAGRDEDAGARFREGASDQTPYTRYLNESAQHDPPLPR
jgi:cytochrome c-type biogenesis protein CcmH/NrfG